ncbi:uncharacterized protein AMSG_08845 [Thecamonas trahens ATCC 50062]|uniref:SPRY domain-containing protein n=1 Tax=Thecamonas trahens ATCC 50062 TaxID=461836 RepID=A0A0L0DLZ9_THETB|nr:hypothetical protein AMSG_08845 [Thecamonas trahens ATCC 50062]KNC53344.1 hypothetical protein AMSG_08845 [Thecamonas trahens ATCC 50062]|eukprot:XP_013754392.1 hypothetical protein AMSG_08845 [Thecamonas trahens ATCC 50062]
MMASDMRRRQHWASRFIHGDARPTLDDVEYTYNEDVLLVRELDCSGGDGGPTRQSWPAFVNDYVEHHKEFPHLYPRTLPLPFHVTRRLIELKLPAPGKPPSARYRLIKKDLELTRSALGISPRGSNGETGSSRAAGDGLISGSDDDDGDGGDGGRGRGSGGSGGDPQNVARSLADASPVIADVVDGFVPSPEMHVPQLQFSDRGVVYDDADSFDMFAPQTFARFVLWAENPRILKEEKALTSELEDIAAEFNGLKSDLRSEHEAARDFRRAEILKLRAREEKRVRAVMDAQFEADVRALRVQHEAHVRLELSKLTFKYEAVLAEIDAFHEAQREQCLKVADELAHAQFAKLEKRVDEVRSATDRIFDPSSLLPLTLLAEHLRAEELKLDCVTVMAANWRKYAHAPELASPHLRDDTRCKILAALEDDALLGTLAVADVDDAWNSVPGLAHHHRDVVTGAGRAIAVAKRYTKRTTLDVALLLREFKYRVLRIAQELASIPLLKLKKIQAEAAGSRTANEYGPWLELIGHELEKRQRSNPTLTLKRGVCSAAAHVNGLVAKPRQPLLYVLVHAATAPRTESQYGACYFEATVLAAPHDPALGTVALGLDVPRSVVEDVVPGITPEPTFVALNNEHVAAGEDALASEPYGFVWQSDGYIHAGGTSHFVGVGFREADVIGVGLDQGERQIHFYKNGESLFSLLADDSVLPRLRIETAGYSLVPAVSFYAALDPDAVEVEFNFAGPFDAELPAHFGPMSSGASTL